MASSKTKSDPGDAITMLKTDHEKVHALFEDFSELIESGISAEKSAIVKRICDELTIHATIEEEIFYPAVRKAIEDGALMDEALVEHACAKDLIAQLESADPKDTLYDAKVTVLGEQIDHHVEEEEGNMFVQARKAKVDTASLGAKMLKRKQALMQELGVADDESDEAQEDMPAAKKKTSRKR